MCRQSIGCVRQPSIRAAPLASLVIVALLATVAPGQQAFAQQTVAPPVSPTVIPPVSPAIPVSPATPVTPLARGGLTPAPVVPPEQMAPPSPFAGSGGGNPAAATPLSGPPVNPLQGHTGVAGTKQ